MNLAEHAGTALKRGDVAPDFELPCAEAEGTVSLAEYRRRGTVLLLMLRGLYCPFCRRGIGLLRPTCDALKKTGVPLLGVVIASPARARQYFRHFPACFPAVAAPDRALHRAYGLPEMERTRQMKEDTERRAREILRERGLDAPPGQAGWVFHEQDGFQMTDEDDAEWKRPLQSVGYFLIGPDGVIRWARVEPRMFLLPKAEEILPFV